MVDITVSSNYLNLLNFILFDVLFCALIFHVTADIAGLLNSRSALTKHENRLSPFNPPVLGVGLTCTRRRVFFAMAFVRLLSIALFFVTNFLIEGKSIPRVVAVRNATVLTFGPGPTPASRSREERLKLGKLVARRQECQGRTDRYMFYGEIRDGNECVTKFHLVNRPVLFGISAAIVPIDMRGDACVLSYKNHTWIQRCKSAIIKCNGPSKGPYFASCGGVIHRRGLSYLCTGPSLALQANGTSAVCREVRGANLDEKYWLPLYGDFLATMQQVIDILYVSGSERRLVRDEDGTRLVSDVHVAWFAILGFVFLMLGMLFGMSVYLRGIGLVRCANDEVGLGSLLADSAESSIDSLALDRSPGVLRSRRTPPKGSSDLCLFVVYNNGEITATRGR